MPLVGGGAKVEIDFESRVDKLLADGRLMLKQQEQIKQQTKETNDTIRRSAKDAEDAAKRQTMSWTDFRSMYSTVLDVVRVGQAVWEETGQKYVDNAVLVGNLARAMGTTTEEASRLKEVADDVGISTDSLRTSMKLALKDGFEPSIDGLARMSDEYLKLEPGTERMQYLMDRFGKSGEEMGKLLEKGGESIRSMSAAMDEGLIVTQEAYEQAKEYKLAVDSLSDSWDALTYKAAPPMVKGMTDIVNSYRDNIRAVELAKEAGMTWGAYMGSPFIQEFKKAAAAEREQADAAILAKETAEQADGAFESETERIKRLGEESKIAEQAIKDMTKANQDELKALGDMTKTIDDYRDKLQDIVVKHDDLLAEKQKLIDQGYSEEGQAILDINEKIKLSQQTWDEATAAFQLATNTRILSRAEELLSIDGLTTAEKDGLIERGIAMGIYTEEAAAMMREEEQAANDLAASLMSIPSEVSTTIRIATIQSTYADDNGAGFDAAHPYRDHGGPGEAGQPYMIGTGAQPEMFIPKTNGTFIPNADKVGQGINNNSSQSTTAVIDDASMDKFIARIETALQRAGK